MGEIRKFPRYTNKRGEDPFIRMYFDENDMDKSKDWGLPIPNEEAAYKSLAKYAKNQPALEDEEVQMMNAAWEMTAAHFGPYMRNSKVRTYDEVKSKLDMSTSSGAPYNILYPTKKELFENDPNIDDHFIKDWDLLACDPNWTCLCTNALKEEMRPTEKIDDNSIRTFTAMACDMTIHGNRLFADMNERMNESWLKTASTVGWSPMKGNWDRLIRKLSVFKNGYALDESQYDSSLRSYMMWGCAKYRWSCLCEADRTPENLQRLKTLYRNLINTLIITPEGVLVMKTGGNPSGSPNTINDNTLILYTFMAYAWLKLHPGGGTNLQEFEDNTAKALTGDDNTWTVSDWANEFYNARTVIECWKGIGITTTTDCLDARKPDELDYLSAHTVYVRGLAVPQYSRDKILTSLLYSTKNKQTPAQALERTNGMLNIGFCDLQMRNYLRSIQNWLLDNYDDVCAEDRDWIVAKCGILDDDRLMELWLGKTFVLQQQSVESAKKDNKSSTKMNNRNIQPQNPSRKQRRGRGGRKGPKASRKNNKSSNNPNRYTGPRPQQQRGRGRNRNGNATTGRLTMRGTNNFGNGRVGNKIQTPFERDEFIANISGSSDFQVNQYPVNPGQSGTFPWLSHMAERYEKYEFKYLEFYYKRTVSEFATMGQTGKVMLMFDADASDGPPDSKIQMEDTEPHMDCMPCENMTLRIPPKILHKFTDGFFVRPGGLPGNSDIKTYDVGNLNVATDANDSAATVIGELRVRYKVLLMIPVLESTVQVPANNSVSPFEREEGTPQTLVTATPTTLIELSGLNAGFGARVAGTGTGIYTVPNGNFLMFWNATFRDATAEAFDVQVDLQSSNGSSYTSLGIITRATSAGGYVNVSGSSYAQFSQGNTVRLRATLTGAAGVLTCDNFDIMFVTA